MVLYIIPFLSDNIIAYTL